jgi:hypothetical protein
MAKTIDPHGGGLWMRRPDPPRVFDPNSGYGKGARSADELSKQSREALVELTRKARDAGKPELAKWFWSRISIAPLLLALLLSGCAVLL